MDNSAQELFSLGTNHSVLSTLLNLEVNLCRLLLGKAEVSTLKPAMKGLTLGILNHALPESFSLLIMYGTKETVFLI